MENKVCMITGANSGIGKAAALQMAEAGAKVIMVCRSRQRGEEALAEIKAKSGSKTVELMVADFSSQKSIRQLVADFKTKHKQLHVLINNAANFDLGIKKVTLTEDGIETIFATNHLGPFLMTNLLLDTMKASAPARIINIASKGLMTHPSLKIDFDDLNGNNRKYSPAYAYYHSKLAQIIFTFELAKVLASSGVTANCIGVTNVKVDISRHSNLPKFMLRMYAFKTKFAITPEQMAKTYVRLAVDRDQGNVTGKYLDQHLNEIKAPKSAYDQKTWPMLWEISAKLTGLKSKSNGKG